MDLVEKKKAVSNLKELLEKENLERIEDVKESIKAILPEGISEANKEAIAVEVSAQIDESIPRDIRESYKENLISFSSMVQEGQKVRMTDYLSAVKFITYRNSGLSITESYKLTKHKEVSQAILEGVSEEKIENRAKAYSQNKIVKQIQSNSQMPLHMVYGDYIVDGINRMHKIIMTGSNRDAINAFDSLARNIMPKNDIEIKVEANLLDDKLKALSEMQKNVAVEVTHKIESGSMSITDLLNKVNRPKDLVIEGELVDDK